MQLVEASFKKVTTIVCVFLRKAPTKKEKISKTQSLFRPFCALSKTTNLRCSGLVFFVSLQKKQTHFVGNADNIFFSHQSKQSFEVVLGEDDLACTRWDGLDDEGSYPTLSILVSVFRDHTKTKQSSKHVTY